MAFPCCVPSTSTWWYCPGHFRRRLRWPAYLACFVIASAVIAWRNHGWAPHQTQLAFVSTVGDVDYANHTMEDADNSVRAAAAESLIMGIFVLVCSVELRDVKADMYLRRGSHLGMGCSLSAWARSTSAPCLDNLMARSGASSPGQGLSCNADDTNSIYEAAGHGHSSHEPHRSIHPETLKREANVGTWLTGPLVLMMILLHVVYPAFPMSPQVEVGRILAFLGFLWSIGPKRCIAVVNTEPLRKSRLLWLTCVCAGVQLVIFLITDTISDLIFPKAAERVDLFGGPPYLQQMFQFVDKRNPGRNGCLTSWISWSILSTVVFSSAVWKEFLFRGVYLGGLRTQMPFWAANMITAFTYSLNHQPINLSDHGILTFDIVTSVPTLMGALWSGYLYYMCNNLVVTVLGHLLVNGFYLTFNLLMHN